MALKYRELLPHITKMANHIWAMLKNASTSTTTLIPIANHVLSKCELFCGNVNGGNYLGGLVVHKTTSAASMAASSREPHGYSTFILAAQ